MSDNQTEPQFDLVVGELLAATEPDETGNIDYQRLASLGLTDPVLGRQLRSVLLMAQHLVDGDVSPEGVTPSLIAVGKIISSLMERAARIEANRP